MAQEDVLELVHASAVELADDVVAGCAEFVDRCDVAVYPPFPYLQAVGRTLGHHGLLLGAQNLYHQSNGAYTGEISTEMLLDLNVKVVLVGHSERRHVIGENDELVNAKARAALDAGLDVVLCVGETLEERQAGRTKKVNVGQLMAGLRDVAPEQIAAGDDRLRAGLGHRDGQRRHAPGRGRGPRRPAGRRVGSIRRGRRPVGPHTVWRLGQGGRAPPGCSRSRISTVG